MKALIPETLNEITLGQMQRYHKLTDGLEDHDEVRRYLLDVFCGIDRKKYDNLNAQQLLDISQQVQVVLNIEPEHQMVFSMNDNDYGFIPNLDDITMGEFVDLESIGDDIKDWHKIMAILYRPITGTFGKRYNIEPYDGYDSASQYKQMPLGVALGALLFFWNLGKDLLVYTLKSLKEVQKDMQVNTILQRSGVGLGQYTDLLKEILDALTKSRPSVCIPAYIGSVMK